MIVLDACAAIGMALGTDEGRALRRLMLKGEETISPNLYVEEIVHALVKYVAAGYYTRDQAQAAFDGMITLVDHIVDTGELAKEVLDESLRTGHSSYDLFYMVLARRNGATLFTLDSKLQALCRSNGIDCVAKMSLDEEM